MPDPDFQIRQGDTASPIYSTLTDENATPVDLDGAAVTFRMRPIEGGAITVEGVAVIEQTGAGELAVNPGAVRFDWAGPTTDVAGDTDRPGFYIAEWDVLFADGERQTYPNGGYVLVLITERVAASSPHYLTVDELKASKELTGTVFADHDISIAVPAAEEAIDGICGWRFWLDAEDQALLFTARTPYMVRLAEPLAELETLEVDEGSGFVEWEAGIDFVLQPLNAAAKGRPYTRIDTDGLAGGRRLPLAPGAIRITGRFGWPSVPATVRQAALLLTARFVKRVRESPMGVVGLGTDTPIRLAKNDPDVMALLENVERQDLIG